MNKKSFSKAPKPAMATAQKIEAFEAGGTGHDQRQTEVETSAAPTPTKRLSLDLPATLHTRFKTACSATERKMGSELQTLIEKRASELEKEAGIS